MHLFTFAACLWVVAACVMVAVSLLSRPADPERIAACLWRPGLDRFEGGAGAPYRVAYRRVGVWCVVIGLVYAAIYARFW
jgi:hypothetical protein